MTVLTFAHLISAQLLILVGLLLRGGEYLSRSTIVMLCATLSSNVGCRQPTAKPAPPQVPGYPPTRLEIPINNINNQSVSSFLGSFSLRAAERFSLPENSTRSRADRPTLSRLLLPAATVVSGHCTTTNYKPALHRTHKMGPDLSASLFPLILAFVCTEAAFFDLLRCRDSQHHSAGYNQASRGVGHIRCSDLFDGEHDFRYA